MEGAMAENCDKSNMTETAETKNDVETVAKIVSLVPQFQIEYPEPINWRKLDELFKTEDCELLNTAWLHNGNGFLRILAKSYPYGFSETMIDEMSSVGEIRAFIDMIKECDKYSIPIVYCDYDGEVLTITTSNGVIHQVDELDGNNMQFPLDEYDIYKLYSEHIQYPKIPIYCYTKDKIEGFRLGLVHSSPYALNERELNTIMALMKLNECDLKLSESIEALKKSQEEFEKYRLEQMAFIDDAIKKIKQVVDARSERHEMLHKLKAATQSELEAINAMTSIVMPGDSLSKIKHIPGFTAYQLSHVVLDS